MLSWGKTVFDGQSGKLGVRGPEFKIDKNAGHYMDDLVYDKKIEQLHQIREAEKREQFRQNLQKAAQFDWCTMVQEKQLGEDRRRETTTKEFF